LPAEPRCVPAVRTVRLRIAPSANPGKKAALVATVGERDRAVAFYTDLFRARREVFAATKRREVQTGPHAGETEEVPWSDEDRPTGAESLTIPTAAHPEIAANLHFHALRRAAIHAGMGAVRSHLSNLRRWEAADPQRRGKRPRPPSPRPHLTAYGPMAQVRLQVKAESRWEWVHFPVQAPPYPDALLQQSQGQREGIATARAEQKQRMAAEGRKKRTAAEWEALRPTPGVRVARSPTIIHKPNGWWWHLPFEERTKIAGKAEDRRLSEPGLKVGTIDLHADSAAAAAGGGPRCLGTRTVWPARENGKREKLLQQVARRQRRSGRSKGSGATRVFSAPSPVSMPRWPGAWQRVFRHPSAEAKRAAEARRGRKAGAAATREGSPATVGAHVGSSTDAPAA
jgi:hypothetical protein